MKAIVVNTITVHCTERLRGRRLHMHMFHTIWRYYLTYSLIHSTYAIIRFRSIEPPCPPNKNQEKRQIEPDNIVLHISHATKQRSGIYQVQVNLKNTRVWLKCRWVPSTWNDQVMEEKNEKMKKIIYKEEESKTRNLVNLSSVQAHFLKCSLFAV